MSQKVLTIKTRSIYYGIFLVLFLLALYYIRSIIFVFLTAVVLSSFVESGVRRFAKRKIGRTLSVIFIYFCALGIIGTLFYFFVPIFLDEVSTFLKLFQGYLPRSQDALGLAQNQVQFTDAIQNLSNLNAGAGGVLQTAIVLFGGVFNFILLIVLSFYLSINKGSIEAFLRAILPKEHEAYAISLWQRTERKIGLWFQGQLLLGVVVGVLTYLGLLIFNVKYALLLALLAAVMELIPFGIFLAAIPAVAAGYATSGTIGAITVAAIYVIIQQFENNLIQPLILKKVIGISTLVIILALLIGVKLAGFWGVMLAIPGAVLLMEILNDIEKKKKAA